MRLHNFEQVRTELQFIAHTPERQRAPGLGTALDHCAQSIECTMDGFPQMKPRILQSTVGALIAKRFLSAGFMSHDVRAPVPGLENVEGLAFEAGRDRLEKAMARFASHQGPLAPHFFYGPLARDPYEALMAMHVANHLDRLAG